MKIFNLFVVVLCAIVLFTACQKELNFDNNGISLGSFKKDAANECLPITVNGNFYKDTVLTNASYVDVEVNVTAAGTFDIKSDTINGYSFSKTGSVGEGSNVIRLYPSGKPLVAQTNTFTVKYGTSTCSFDITVTTAGGGGGGGAVYTLGGTPNNCTGVTLNGTYMAGIATNASNTAKMDVNVTVTGTYTLNTAIINGVKFSGSGNFSTLGAQQVTLTATGTPVASGPFNYPVTGGSSCSFSVTYAPKAPPATYTLSGGPGNCAPVTINGTYAQGVALTAANTVVVEVNVSVVGSYTLYTNTVNGMTFSASGLFSATGLQNVTLYGNGTPAAAANSVLTPQTGTSSCDFTIVVNSAPVPTGVLTCKINGVFTSFNLDAQGILLSNPPGQLLSISGSVSSSSSELLNLALANGTGNLAAGTYNQSSGMNIVITANYMDASGGTWIGFTFLGTPFTIVITSLTPTRAIGTFFGTVKDGNGQGPNTKILTEGVFNVPL